MRQYSYETSAKEVFILGIIFKKHYKDDLNDWHKQFIILQIKSQKNWNSSLIFSRLIRGQVWYLRVIEILLWSLGFDFLGYFTECVLDIILFVSIDPQSH